MNFLFRYLFRGLALALGRWAWRSYRQRREGGGGRYDAGGGSYDDRGGSNDARGGRFGTRGRGTRRW